MRTRFTTIFLALLAALLCAGIFAVSALASTGGAASPSATGSGSTSTPTPAVKLHKSAIATWFGPGFYGQQTACGQTLTPATAGVANRKLRSEERRAGEEGRCRQ